MRYHWGIPSTKEHNGCVRHDIFNSGNSYMLIRTKSYRPMELLFNNKVNLILALCLLVVLPLQAQYSLLKSADREFDAFNVINAIELYQRAYEVKPNIHTAERLAESYYHIRDYREAETWYARLANHDEA